MQFVTDFADQAIMLPLALVFAVGLAVTGWWRGCAAWTAGVVAMIGTMAFLKYICFACAHPLGWTGVLSPSGHTAASATIYGGAALLLLRRRIPASALIAVVLAIVALFGVSRLVVHAHTPAEVVVGGVVGLFFAAFITLSAGPRPVIRVRRLMILGAILALAFHGLRLQAEADIHHSILFTWIPLPATCRA